MLRGLIILLLYVLSIAQCAQVVILAVGQEH